MIRTAREGHNSDSPAAQRFRAFVERIERLQEERKTIADDIAEIFKELTSDGFDKEAAKTVLKIRAAKDGIETWTVRSHVVDTYLAALGMLPDSDPRAPAGARVENITEFRSKSEEESVAAPAAPASSLAAHEADESAAPISDADVPAFLVKQQKPLRPDCLEPESCAGYGTKTCHRCTTAARERELA